MMKFVYDMYTHHIQTMRHAYKEHMQEKGAQQQEATEDTPVLPTTSAPHSLTTAEVTEGRGARTGVDIEFEEIGEDSGQKAGEKV